MLIQRQFNDWSQFASTIESRIGETCWHEASTRTSSWYAEFSQTGSLQDAVDLVRNGWPEGTQKLIDGLEAFDAGRMVSPVPTIEWDVAGECPDVAAYCAGIPEHMATQEFETEQSSPLVSISVNGAAAWRIDSSRIIRYGVMIASHVRALLQAGYSPRLDWCCALNGNGRKNYLMTVPLLERGETVDIDRIAFAIAHPSMLRRAMFAVAEIEGWRGLGQSMGSVMNPLPAEIADDYDVSLPGIGSLSAFMDTDENAKAAVSPYFNQFNE